MTIRSGKLLALTIAVAPLLIPMGAHAAGFYIQEQSVRGLGAAFSGSTTSLDDASTIWFNPAGMTDLDRAQINAGVHLLIPSASVRNQGSTFDFNGPGAGGVGPVAGGNGGNPYSPTPVPNLFAAMPLLGGDLWAGIGITAPFGLASDYGDEWFGRFDSTKTELTTINVAPSLAYKASSWLSIGGGLDVQYVDAELQSRVSNFASEGTSKLEGDDISIGYNIGLKISPAAHTDIGLHYRSAMHHELDGRISASGLTPNAAGADFNVPGKANLKLPDIATIGIAHDLTPEWRIMGQATWFGWNHFNSIAAVADSGATLSNVQQNYQTTWAFAIGAEYDVNEDWTVRGGYQFDQTPTTDQYRTSRTPDGDRNWFSAGATWHMTPDFSLDMAATYIDVDEGTIDVTRNSGYARTRAKTDGDVGIVAIGLSYKF